MRLEQGDVFELGGADYVVDFVNGCRAHCLPLKANAVKIIKSRFEETERRIERFVPINISPHSDVKVKRSLKRYRSKDRYVIDTVTAKPVVARGLKGHARRRASDQTSETPPSVPAAAAD